MEDQVLVSWGCQYFNIKVWNPKTTLFLKERKLLFQPSFWSCPVSSTVMGRAGLFLLLFLQKVMGNPFPRLHSCAHMEWERWDNSVLSLADVTTSSLKTSLCIFFFFCLDACQHLFSRRKSTYTNICQEQEGKAIWSGSTKWACL